MAKPSCDHNGNTHCVHQSERRSFRGCKQRWNWAYREHLTPWAQAKPLEFGIAIHKAMEIFFNVELWGKLTNLEKLERAINVFDECNQEQRTRFLQSNSPGEDDYEERMQLGAGMLRHYAEEVHPKEDNWLVPVLTEVPFQVPLYVPDMEQFRKLGTAGDPVLCTNSPNCGQVHDNPAPVTLNGRVDAIFQDKRSKAYWIYDWKTAANVTTNDTYLYLDTQIVDYTAALILELNLNIHGFVYAEMKKAIPTAPKENKKPRAGRLFSVNKQQPTNYEMAERTFRVYDSEAYENGLYDDYLEFLKGPEGPVFHKRFYIRSNVEKMRNALKYASLEAIDMVNPDMLIYPSTGKFTCNTCAFIEPCQMVFMGEDHDFLLESSFVKGELVGPEGRNVQEE